MAKSRATIRRTRTHTGGSRITYEQLKQIRNSLKHAEGNITTAILNAQTAGSREWESLLQNLGLRIAALTEEAHDELQEIKTR